MAEVFFFVAEIQNGCQWPYWKLPLRVIVVLFIPEHNVIPVFPIIQGCAEFISTIYVAEISFCNWTPKWLSVAILKISLTCNFSTFHLRNYSNASSHIFQGCWIHLWCLYCSRNVYSANHLKIIKLDVNMVYKISTSQTMTELKINVWIHCLKHAHQDTHLFKSSAQSNCPTLCGFGVSSVAAVAAQNILFQLLACWLLTTDLSQPSLEAIGIGMPHIWSEDVPSATKMACADTVCLAQTARIVTCEVLHTKTIFDGFFKKVFYKTLFQGLLWALWGQYGIIRISNRKHIIQWPSPFLPLLSYLCSIAEHTHSNSCHTHVDTAQTVKIVNNICDNVINHHILMTYRNNLTIFFIPFGSIFPVAHISGRSLIMT